jgi:hypothetical protein
MLTINVHRRVFPSQRATINLRSFLDFTDFVFIVSQTRQHHSETDATAYYVREFAGFAMDRRATRAV